VISIPPHTCRKIQPLDISFFLPLKSFQKREYGQFMRSQLYEAIRMEYIFPLFNTSYQQIAAIAEAV
jgi:hypothetical protein